MDLKQNNLDEKIKGVVSTPKGKGVVAGLILVIIVMLVLLVVTFAVPQPTDISELTVNKDVTKSLDKTPQMPVAQKSKKPSDGVVSADPTVTAEETESIKYSEEIMKFRDPFAPIIESTTTSGSKTVYTASSTGNEESSDGTSNNGGEGTEGESSAGSNGGSEAGDNTGGTPTNSIILSAIADNEGTRYGAFLYNGAQYMAAAGDVIGDSSYQVLEIGEGSATLLYGDDRLTISLGEEVVK